MAKKRPQETIEMNPTESTLNHATDLEQTSVSDAPSTTTESVHPLMEEIQTFLNLRDELAKKLAIEIEATEEKLAELKRTAASLFPGNSGDAPEEKKVKKPKPKAVPREEKPSANTSDEQEMAA